MILLGVVLLVLGLAVSYLVPDPLVGRLGRIVAIIGAVLILLGVILLALHSGDVHTSVGLLR